jgi:hypothetical protein
VTIVRPTRADVDLSKIDRAALQTTADAEIEAQIAADPGTAPIFTADELARARRVVPPLRPIATEPDAVTRALGR